jgi:hypothetical protein
VPLVSRKGLCVHQSISKIENGQSQNEKCQDLMDKHGCDHMD